MEHRTLLLGHTGKMGLALQHAFQQIGTVIGHNSSSFDAADSDAVRKMVLECQPQVIINAVAFVGVDPCEKNPVLAQQINALFPRQLAQLSQELSCVLIHISGSTVFPDIAEGAWTEAHCPSPINVYGTTKLAGDCLVAYHAPRHYTFRLPILFGPASQPTQFVEKMLDLSARGTPVLRIADDVFYSPSYTRDLAERIRQVYQEQCAWGLYHLANDGMPSLYELMQEFDRHLGLSAELQPVPQRSLDFLGVKPVRIPLASVKLPPLRPWQEAVADYCRLLQGKC